MKIDYNPKIVGYVLLVLALFFAIAKIGPSDSAKKVNEANKAYEIKRDNVSEKVVLKPFPVDCPKGSSKLPDSEIKKFSSRVYEGGIVPNIFGEWNEDIRNFTDWDIDSVQVLFEIIYNNGTTRQIIFNSQGMGSPHILYIPFNIGKKDLIETFTDVKKCNYRVVRACGKIRPMKIEIKAKEALKEAGESINKVIKGFDDLFSR